MVVEHFIKTPCCKKGWCWNTCGCCCCCGGSSGTAGGSVLTQAAGRRVPGLKNGALYVVSWFVDTSRSSDDWMKGRRLVKGVMNPDFFLGHGFKRCNSVATFLRAVWKNLLHAKQPERAYACLKITVDLMLERLASSYILFYHLC